MYQGRTLRDAARRKARPANARRSRQAAPRRAGPPDRRTARRLMRLAALAAVLTAGLFLGCTFFASKEPAPPPAPAVMPMTSQAVSDCLARVQTAKAALARPVTVEDFVRYAAAAYVEPIRSRYAVAETVEAAVRQAASGDPQARRFLAGTVRDAQLLAAMGGRTFSVDQWREIYVRSGLLDQDTFVAIGGELPKPGREPAGLAQEPEQDAAHGPIAAAGGEPFGDAAGEDEE